jgi:DNA (cytosine-5)-methyltransferase 1
MAGFKTAFQVEKDSYAGVVLEKRWPDVARHTDVRQCNASNLPHIDILSGGFPCQQISIAGRQEGIGTEEDPTDRSGLWFQFLRLISELRPYWSWQKS